MSQPQKPVQKRSPDSFSAKKKTGRGEMFKKAAKNFFAQFGTAIIAVAIVSYVFLQLMLNVGSMIEVENAAYATVNHSAELDAFLFRDETLIPSGGSSGTPCFLASEGEKVRINQTVAVTYSDSADAETQKRINEIDRRISVLEKSSLSSGEALTSVSKLDSEIDALMLSMLRNTDSNALSKVLREQEELLILMNRRQAIVQAHSYEKELTALYAEKEQLAQSLTGANFSSQAPISGYFYSTVDGYENTFTLDALQELTVEKFLTLADSEPDTALVSSAVGKIVVGSTWYVAVGVDKLTASGYTEGRQSEITFQYSNNTRLMMTLERKITKTDSDTVVLVFSSKTMPDGFDYSRLQTVELPVESYEGLRIPASALRVNNGVTGVYTLSGSRAVFKETEVLHEYGSYVICRIPVNPNYPNRRDVAYSSKKYLSLHDAVIVSGSDIYDGKILT